MHARHHPLPGLTPGTQRAITSWHYGPAGKGRKVYIQAGLHADELPGMLVAHHLRERLRVLEDEGRLHGEVVVVPSANPVGLAQSVLRTNAGRFDLASGDNFNRHYPALAEAALPRLAGRLGADADANVRAIRAALLDVVAELHATTELAGQRKTLLGLAIDAEIVLDLHCDGEALVHLYTAPALWPEAQTLARCLGAEATLLADASGDDPFDEACSGPWAWLQAHVDARFPVPHACLSVTVELRGMADVSHALAAADADALLSFLAHRGIVGGPASEPAPLRRDATRLDAVDVLVAPAAGVVAFRRELGEWIARGDVVVDVVDPVSGVVHAVASRTDGLLFAREAQRNANAGRALAKIAGAVTVRSGKLTSE